jgi:hypothetical protein
MLLPCIFSSDKFFAIGTDDLVIVATSILKSQSALEKMADHTTIDRLRKSRTAACGFLCIVQSRVINQRIYERILGHSDEI